MTDRAWIGGHNNNRISSPSNWSVRGSLQPGDRLTATHGTINIQGDQLPDSATLTITGPTTVNVDNAWGDALFLISSATLNLSYSSGTDVAFLLPYQSHVVVNAHGWNFADFHATGRFSAGDIIVNNDGTLIGGFSPSATDVAINGGTFVNTTSTAGFDGQMSFINADVVGPGEFYVTSFHSPGRGTLEFTRAVGSGQTVHMQSGVGFSVLEVDRPDLFKAAISWESERAVVDLNGLAADSYTYDRATNTLSLYNGSQVADTLRISTPTPEFATFTVSQGTSAGGPGIEIHSPGQFANERFGPELPQHVPALV